MRVRRVLPSGQKRLFFAAAWAMACAGICSSARAAVVFGQVDDFTNGSPAGWEEGASSPNPPTVVSSGGPGGANDKYLQNISSGVGSSGSRMVQLNDAQWTGNFASQGVTRVGLDMANFGATPLAIRIAIQDLSGTRFASTTPVPLPGNDGTWHHAVFELTPTALTSIGGPDDLSTVLHGVTEFRILSAASGPSFLGDSVAATLGVDNIRALRLPGDANFDGVVGPADFNLLATNFGLTTGATWSQGDFNFDGQVGPGDFNLLASNFSLTDPGGPRQPAAAISAVPEPEMMSLFAIGGALAAMGRRRSGAER